ncbi:hypothetical protein MMC25_006425 [Agyrium rufum]|nr:hypothetical protein [Agyrium rufum]
MAIPSWLKKGYWICAGLGALYAIFVSLLLNREVQTQALYAHKLNTAFWYDLNKPEQWGFLKNQVRPFFIPTADGEKLYSWHIAPLGLYSKKIGSFVNEPTGLVDDIRETTGFQALKTDPEARLVISFHGNAGHVAQGLRTETYRNIGTVNAEKLHILSTDYRGFGLSSGAPSEEGLIQDGIAMVRWALDVAQVPPERILLLGQSLGTAVATAVAEHFAVEARTEFAGVILVAPFSNLPSLLLTYTIGGVIPILSPLKPYPFLQKFFSDRLVDRWPTSERLANLIRASNDLKITIIHAKDDYEIPWKHSDVLFYTAANATSEQGMTIKQIDGVKQRREFDDAGWRNSWTAVNAKGGHIQIKEDIIRHGGHNRILTYSAVPRAIYELLFA